MPSSAAGYDEQAVQDLFPPELIALFQESPGGGRTPHGVALLERHLRRASRAPGTRRRRSTQDTPEQSQSFIEDILKGESLL